MTANLKLIEKLDVNERYFGEIIYDNGDGIIGGEYRNGEKLVEKINEIIDYLTQPQTSPAVNDSQPKKVKIDRKIKIGVVRQLERPIVNYECDCGPYCLEYGDNYCPQCGVKIKWIA